MKIKIGIIILLAFILRVILAFSGALQLDQNTFVAWSNILATGGFPHFYLSWSDYLPGYLYILYLLGKLKFIPEILLYKLPAIFADLATGYLIYVIVKKLRDQKAALLAAALYIFNPAILVNSTLWGQVDSLTALFSLLAVYLIDLNPYLSAISLAIGTLIKPQAAFILPVILILMVKNKWKLPKMVVYGVIGLTVFILGFVPFVTPGRNLWLFIWERLTLSASQYPYASINAFNFWGIFAMWKSDNLIYQIAGAVFSLLVLAGVVYKTWHKKGAEYLWMAIIFLATFLFLTRIHERHMLPVFAPLVISAAVSSELLVVYAVLSFTYVANLLYAFIWISQNFKSIFSDAIIKIISGINILCLGFLAWGIKIKLKLNFNYQVEKFPEISLSKKKIRLILLGIIAFALFSRVIFLGNPPHEYFDEVYHAFTARQMLHGNPAAWEWWNTPPEGFAYEWTHPPVAKLGMWFSMAIIGENAFAWRLPGAILGTLAVYLVFLIGQTIFKDDLVGLLAAGAFSLDGLALTMSRIGMNDVYILFFMLLAVYLFLKEKNLGAALAFGLAMASKWSAVWAIPIMGLIWLTRKNKWRWSYLWFAILPFAVYLLTYTPMFTSGHGLDIFWGMQKQMWWYHTNLKATHPYQSGALSWPFLIRPVYLYTSNEVNGMVARIYNLGNPSVFWFGLVAVATSVVYSFLERNKQLGLVIFSYLIFFVPWMASPRIMFFYHYLPAVPFMCILIGYVLRRNPKAIIYFLVPSAMLFLYFFPHWVGIKIPLWWDSSYYWFPSWR
jgi:predicted membrane-bound dolichyl-phosphate-mannose-protein mannosyltransferase